jgi:NADPH:quinone reductase-like Zn-dependent oxidoreductase
MRALVCRALGDPTIASSDAIHVVEVPGSPSLPPSALKVRVAAAALNFADLLMIQGQYQAGPGSSSTPYPVL